MLHALLLTIGLTLIASFVPPQQRLDEVDRQQALTHLQAGQAAMARERFEVAEREFRDAIRLNPRLELAHYGLGQVLMATRRYEHAVDAFVSCRNLFQVNVATDQDDRVTYERRLDDQIQSKRDELRALETGRARTTNTASSVDRVRSELGQLERLRRRSRESTPEIPAFILTALGSAYFRTGAFADAEREWRLAVAVEPTIGEIHNNLAVVCMVTGRYDEAEREIQLAEKAGFRVSPAFKEELTAKRARKQAK